MGLYKNNKKAKVGDIIECPVCHTKFFKKQYSQAFCCKKCKDKFWNSKGDRHHYNETYNGEYMTDKDWDAAFEVGEYNI